MTMQVAPIVHSVHFYESDEALIQRLGSIVLSGFDAGVGALLIMTPQHKQQILRFLKRRNIDPHAAERDGKLCILDAEQTLSAFMRNGLPRPDLFKQQIGAAVECAQTASTRSGLTAFGEMVAILWQQGNRRGAMELEKLWNELLDERDFHLHCAYPKSLFTKQEAADLHAICEQHSLAVGVTAAA